MTEQQKSQWQRFTDHYLHCPEIGLSLDVSRMHFGDRYLAEMEPAVQKALTEMEELERGAIANRDENRMVGHYWLRAPHLSPTAEISAMIETTITRIERFVEAITTGKIRGAGGKFENLLVIGIGGSALGPQFVSRALVNPVAGSPELYFIDNTDPDGIDMIMGRLRPALGRTLCIVISKSGGTKETRNGMLEAMQRYREQGLAFASHAVAVTGEGSELDKIASGQGWLDRFPMWDWVGGRTSELSAVGLVPAALQGIPIRELLRGAAACDQVTRQRESRENPAAMMALMWFSGGNGKGEKDMVVLPYKDRLELFSRYLQQLIMESLGKERDRTGGTVNQGLAVYGNKGSTDQHAYVQQLRDGINNFFVTFINVLEARQEESIDVDPGVETGDYLNGFFLGTREALSQSQRQSMTVTLNRLDPFGVGVLIALFERAVGLYASLINVNAYHQPGVEAGKKAATDVLTMQGRILRQLREHGNYGRTAFELSGELGHNVDPEQVFLICRHLAATRPEVREAIGAPIWDSRYRVE